MQILGLRGREKKLGWGGGSVRAVMGLGEGTGFYSPGTHQVDGRVWHPVEVVPPTGERHAGQSVAGARRGWVAALGARSLWGWKESCAESGACLSGSPGIRSRLEIVDPSGAFRLERGEVQKCLDPCL